MTILFHIKFRIDVLEANRKRNSHKTMEICVYLYTTLYDESNVTSILAQNCTRKATRTEKSRETRKRGMQCKSFVVHKLTSAYDVPRSPKLIHLPRKISIKRSLFSEVRASFRILISALLLHTLNFSQNVQIQMLMNSWSLNVLLFGVHFQKRVR